MEQEIKIKVDFRKNAKYYKQEFLIWLQTKQRD